MKQIVFASRNLHKMRELKGILKTVFKCDLIHLTDFPNYIPPEETGKTFEENAILKAVHAAKELKCIAIADDSGLVVPALQGAPGIFSARYAGSGATDAENRKKLLGAMKHLRDDERCAYFECVVALATPEGLKKCTRGTCEGRLLSQERGTSGFGYDPLFVKHDYSKTFAELDELTKNRISHRRKAIDKLLPHLESIH